MIVTPNRPGRSGCPIASTLDLVGDRWTMVLVRDMLTGKARYAEFLASPARITTNVNGGGTMHDAESPGGPVAAAQEMRHSWSLVGCDEGQEMYSVEVTAHPILASRLFADCPASPDRQDTHAALPCAASGRPERRVTEALTS